MTAADEVSIPSPTTTELLRIAAGGDGVAWTAARAAVRARRRRHGRHVSGCQERRRARRRRSRPGYSLLETHRDQIREPEALGAWLRTTARRECLRILARPAGRPTRCRPTTAPRAPTRAATSSSGSWTWTPAGQLDRHVRCCPTRSRALDPGPCSRTTRPATPSSRGGTGIPVGSIGPTRARALRKLRRHDRVGYKGQGELEGARDLLRTALAWTRRVHAELGEDTADVDADRLLADVEPLADLAVGQAGGELGEHLELARV